MRSESVRMTTAAEAAYRIGYPNSKPRLVKVIALDEPSRAVVDAVAAVPWQRAAFFTTQVDRSAAPPRAERASVQAWLRDIAGQTTDLMDEVRSADLVVMVATAGSSVDAAMLIGEACFARGVTAIGVLMQGDREADAMTEATAEALRRVSTMLVVATGADYIEAMLTALRA